MPLQAGARLGPYEVLSALGAGGMGEVWRARDDRLGREVALKVLPEAFVADPDRLARFQREARVLASLSHPNIGGIHGLEEADGIRALVLELVEGPTLADRIARGPIPVDEALPIAKQIADALEAAHEQGIVHRDLKPANIKVRHDGTVKVLDFGLAKALQPELAAVQSDLSHSPTLSLSAAATQMGVILGTAAYMAPEQARGRPVDKRADIWAFGCVLFEMLSGRRTFEGASAPDLLVAVLSTQPEWTALPAEVPVPVVRLIRRCLEKDPKRRLRDIGDVAADLDGTDELRETGVERSQSVRALPFRWRPWWLLGAAGAGLLVGLVAASWLRPEPEGVAPGRVTRTLVTLEEGDQTALAEHTPLGIARLALTLSPDGENLAYVAVREGETHLYLRPMDELEARLLPGTEGAFNPFFSPDGQWIAFFTPTHLRKISIRGGMPDTVCEAANVMGASWGQDDRILFAGREGTELSIVSPRGGPPEVLVRTAWADGSFHHPELLPDGESILVTIWKSNAVRVAVVSTETDEQRVVVERGGGARYVPTGHLVYTGEGGVMAARFDLATMTIQGPAAPVLPGVRREEGGWTPQLAFSADGGLVYVAGEDMSVTVPVWVDRRTGAEEAIALPPQRYGTFRLSPDGTRLAMQIGGAGSDVWLYDFARGVSPAKLTTGATNLSPIWRPDGRRITFLSERAGEGGIYEHVAGAVKPELILATTDARRWPWPNSWSGSGVLTFDAAGPDTGNDVWVMADKASEPQPFVRTPAAEWGSAFSPDGRFIAYTSDESGQYEVYVKRYPATEERWQISAGYGEEPVWSAAGGELFFRRGRDWFSAPIRTEPDLEHQPPRILFSGPYLNVAGLSYDAAPDGTRFLVLKQPEQRPATQIHVVANWFEELKRLVPAS